MYHGLRAGKASFQVFTVLVPIFASKNQGTWWSGTPRHINSLAKQQPVSFCWLNPTNVKHGSVSCTVVVGDPNTSSSRNGQVGISGWICHIIWNEQVSPKTCTKTLWSRWHFHPFGKKAKVEHLQLLFGSGGNHSCGPSKTVIRKYGFCKDL
jgi:hypothetical protein